MFYNTECMTIREIGDYLIWFMIYSFIGWIYESGLRSFTHKRWYNSGFLNGPYIPIYGCGAVLDIYFLGSLRDPFLIFFLAANINCILEYMTSYEMEELFHARWWDYSKKPLNINGRIYYMGYIAFGVFATLTILYLHPWLKAHTTDNMSDTAVLVSSLLVILIISIDTFITVRSMKDFQEKMETLTLALEEHHERISKELMERIDSLQSLERIKELEKRLNAQERRLFNAFPDLKFHNIRYTAEEIRSMIIEQNKKLFR